MGENHLAQEARTSYIRSNGMTKNYFGPWEYGAGRRAEFHGTEIAASPPFRETWMVSLESYHSDDSRCVQYVRRDEDTSAF